MPCDKNNELQNENFYQEIRKKCESPFFLTKYYQMISTIKEKNNAKNAV